MAAFSVPAPPTQRMTWDVENVFPDRLLNFSQVPGTLEHTHGLVPFLQRTWEVDARTVTPTVEETHSCRIVRLAWAEPEFSSAVSDPMACVLSRDGQPYLHAWHSE